jgi:hypothetical protein
MFAGVAEARIVPLFFGMETTYSDGRGAAPRKLLRDQIP